MDICMYVLLIYTYIHIYILYNLMNELLFIFKQKIKIKVNNEIILFLYFLSVKHLQTNILTTYIIH